MSKSSRFAAFAAVLLVVALAAPTPAGAATRAQKARKIDALRASDRELSGAVRTLNGQVDAQIARVKAAQQAASAAEASFTRASAELEAAEKQIANLHGAVVAEAVTAYMRPQGQEQPAMSTDLAETSRQRALLAHVEKRQGDALDALRAAREDLAARESAASRARDAASRRKRDATAQLDALARDLKDKRRLSTALEARIRAAEAEDAAASSLGGYFGDAGVVSKSGLIWPVRGPVTSGFGQRWGRQHAGIDIAASGGTPIKAARAGKVTFSGTQGGYGNVVIISHGEGFATLYAHQSRRAAKVGDVVKQGEVIGYVGSTGHSTGNHLHFETRVNGTPQNPRRYLP